MSCRCDVECIESEQQICIGFQYTFGSQTQQYFHFKRNKSETLRQTFARISLNINKKRHKNKHKSKTVKDSVQRDDKIEIMLRMDDMVVSEDTVNSDVWKSGQTLVVGDSEYEVYLNCPTVRSIRLPKTIMSSFKVYPLVCLQFCTINECKYHWFSKPFKRLNASDSQDRHKNQVLESESKDTESDEWLEVGQGFHYNTSVADIGRQLKVICVPNNGIQSEALSENPIEANPGLCPFEERHQFCTNDTTFGTFRVMSYNILADVYADSDYSRTVLYPYCPPYALSIDYRKQLLVKELIGYNSDICCLQEVDSQVFASDLNPIMSSLQNKNSSKPKYESMFSEKGTTGEGLATFYNTSKFEVLDFQTVIPAKEIQLNPIFAKLLQEVKTNEKLFARLIARKNIFQSILLRSLEHKERAVLLGNIHLYYHPDADHIRLIQSYIFVKYIENSMKKMQKIWSELKISPILCGDYNSCPEFAVFQLMTTGFVGKDVLDFKSNSDETIEGMDLSHGLHLGSACGQPLYTNYTPFFDGCLDYIFYETNDLIVSEVIPFASHEQVIQNTAIPSIVFPSDHLSLICLLKWNQL